ncbi:MAG: hypothetical protein HY820_24950 [Acidobacteria bacterium]|nr:hypothetical protein [Acidobacteriota bacterium]
MESVELVAFLDSGASDCLFDRVHGELLGINVESGEPRRFRTATGTIEAFGHVVILNVLGLAFQSMVFFFADERLKKNLLGRRGWLDRIQLGIIDYDQILFLSHYDS